MAGARSPSRKRASSRATSRKRCIEPRLDAERPVAILSGNSIDHALVGLGAMMAGLPYAPVSPPYSLVAKDFAKLTRDHRRPDAGPRVRQRRRAVPAGDRRRPARATSKSSPGRNPPSGRAARACSPNSLLTDATSRRRRSPSRASRRDTIGKFLFTSGSTGTPKGVINTHAMMTSNQAMLQASIRASARSRRCCSNGCPGATRSAATTISISCSANGGSLYIDEGRPLPRRDREDGPQPARDLADHLLQRAQGFRDAAALSRSRTRRCGTSCSRGCSPSSTRARRCRPMCASELERLSLRDGRPRHPDADLARLDRDRPVRAQRHGASLRSPA